MVTTGLPWRNLSNLTVFEFRHPDEMVDLLFTAQLLYLLANTSLLSGVVLCPDIPVSCNQPSDGPAPLEEAFIDDILTNSIITLSQPIHHQT